MKSIRPHIFIKNCKEVIEHYQQVLGGEIKRTQLSDGIEMFKGQEGKYIHAELHVNDRSVLYFADVFSPDAEAGSQISLTLELESEAEQDRLYDALARDGGVNMELQETFWNSRYASVTDKYGLTWELNLPLA